MQIENNTIVSLRYVMRNENGDVMEDNINGTTYEYLHGTGNLMPALEDAMKGLSVGESKTFSVTDKLLKGVFHFDVIIENIRTATDEEVGKGIPLTNKNCGPDCCC